MINSFLQIIAPHHCYSCLKIGTLLCDNCKENIINEAQTICFGCNTLTVNGVCRHCLPKLHYSAAWFVGERSDDLKKVIDAYKFSRTVAASEVLADLLHRTLPVLPSETIIVPIPTISRHIRLRGYDHALLLAHSFAKKRNLPVKRCIKRQTSSAQVGAGALLRKKQADNAFVAGNSVDTSAPHLIIDDIFTTGATVGAAARLLRNAGVKEVWVAVVARQPLR